MEIVGDDIGSTSYHIPKINSDIAKRCNVIDIQRWGSYTKADVKKQAELYERFVEIYHNFWKNGICQDKESDVDTYDINDDLGPDENDSPSTRFSKKDIFDEKEPHEDEDTDETQEIESLNADENRKHIRKDILNIERPFDKWDIKTPTLSTLLSNDKHDFEFSRLIYKRLKSGNIKINEYTGTMQYYVLQNKGNEFKFNDRDDILIQRHEPLAMALLYHWTPISTKSTKAKEFFYLAHIGVSSRLKSNGIGYMLFSYLRDDVVGDKPLFLEMDPTPTWKKLCRQYETWGFHTAYEMRTETSNADWNEWYHFYKLACQNGWTAVVYGEEIKTVFTHKSPDTDLWMVYWKRWYKHPLTEAEYRAPYSVVRIDHNMLSAADEAIRSSGVLVHSNEGDNDEVLEDQDVDEEQDHNLLPSELIAIPSDAWRAIFTPQITKRQNIFDELIQTLSGRNVTYSQVRKSPIDENVFLQPSRIQSGIGRDPLYQYEFRKYLLIAPRAGVLDVEPNTPGDNQVPLSIGEPCGFASCILLKPATAQCDCPPLWIIDQLGIESKDTAHASVEILLRSMLTLLKSAAMQNKMLLLMKNSHQFKVDYGWVLQDLGFVFGNTNGLNMNHHAGAAYTKFFMLNSDGKALQYALNPRSPPHNQQLKHIYTQLDCPHQDASWACYWGGQHPIPLSSSWAQALASVNVSTNLSRLDFLGSALIDNASTSASLDQSDTFHLDTIDTWLLDSVSNKMAQLTSLYSNFHAQISNANLSNMKSDDLCLDGTRTEMSVNWAYEVTRTLYVLHSKETVHGFASVLHFVPYNQKKGNYLIPFVFIKGIFALTSHTFKILHDKLQETVGGCIILSYIGNFFDKPITDMTTFQALLAKYTNAGFEPSKLILQKDDIVGQMYIKFFEYISKSIDTMVNGSFLFKSSKVVDEIFQKFSINDIKVNGLVWLVSLPSVSSIQSQDRSKYLNFYKDQIKKQNRNPIDIFDAGEAALRSNASNGITKETKLKYRDSNFTSKMSNDAFRLFKLYFRDPSIRTHATEKKQSKNDDPIDDDVDVTHKSKIGLPVEIHKQLKDWKSSSVLQSHDTSAMSIADKDDETMDVTSIQDIKLINIWEAFQAKLSLCNEKNGMI
jgi:hypothetical protein